MSSLFCLPDHHFCGICRRQCHYEFNTVYWKSCIVFCAKLKEVDPIKLISLRQISLSIALKYIINNNLWKYTESGHRWLQLFLFSLKTSITAISFYWRNDTSSFVTWRSRLATAPDTPTCIVSNTRWPALVTTRPIPYLHQTSSVLGRSPLELFSITWNNLLHVQLSYWHSLYQLQKCLQQTFF